MINTDRIFVDYIPGTHGPLVAYLCNLASNPNAAEIYEKLPYNESGLKKGVRMLQFVTRYYLSADKEHNGPTVGIVWDKEKDLLPFMLSSIHSSASELNPTNLHIDTYNKLNTVRYKGILESINKTYNLHLMPGDDCPKFYLREYFKFGFKNPRGSGFNKMLDEYLEQTKATYFVRLYNIYHYPLLVKELENISEHFNVPMDITEDLYEIHDEFLQQQPYFAAAEICDGIVRDVQEGIDIDIPEDLTVLHQAYINAKLELLHDDQIEMPFYDEHWFETTGEIIEYINDQLTKMEKHNIITT